MKEWWEAHHFPNLVWHDNNPFTVPRVVDDLVWGGQILKFCNTSIFFFKWFVFSFFHLQPLLDALGLSHSLITLSCRASPRRDNLNPCYVTQTQSSKAQRRCNNSFKCACLKKANMTKLSIQHTVAQWLKSNWHDAGYYSPDVNKY